MPLRENTDWGISISSSTFQKRVQTGTKLLNGRKKKKKIDHDATEDALHQIRLRLLEDVSLVELYAQPAPTSRGKLFFTRALFCHSSRRSLQRKTANPRNPIERKSGRRQLLRRHIKGCYQFQHHWNLKPLPQNRSLLQHPRVDAADHAAGVQGDHADAHEEEGMDLLILASAY